MGGFNPKRKMMRTKREAVFSIENENRQMIQGLVNHLNTRIAPQMTEFQKLILAMKHVLIERRLMTDLDLHQALSSIEELERMKREGLIIGEKKDEQSG